MEFVGLVVVFFPLIKKENAVKLLESYGFDNIEIVDAWSTNSLGIRVPKEDKDMWFKILYNEGNVWKIIVVNPQCKEKNKNETI